MDITRRIFIKLTVVTATTAFVKYRKSFRKVLSQNPKTGRPYGSGLYGKGTYAGEVNHQVYLPTIHK